MTQMTKSLVDAAEAIKQPASALNAQPSHLMKSVLKNLASRKCGVHPMAPSETFSAARSFAEPIICKNVPRLVPGWTDQL